jgi:hypothetical protein
MKVELYQGHIIVYNEENNMWYTYFGDKLIESLYFSELLKYNIERFKFLGWW